MQSTSISQSEAQVKRHEPLYLKHRPQSLEQLVGQDAVTRTLTNAINYDRISHAYLFTGPRGTGKTSSARILAKSLNCKTFEKAVVSPCQTCASCLEIKGGTSPAVFEIDAASNNSVDDARILIERAPLVAPGGRYKIYIIDECHMLTKEAFNALLKTIEDPPPNVVFILATTEEHKVLPTIVSRCQRLMFRLVAQDALVSHLKVVAASEQIAITDQAVDFIARRAGGGLRDALGLLDQASLLSTPEHPVDVADLLTLLGALHEDVLLQMSEHVLHRRGHELLTSAAQLLQEGREPATIVQELARHFLNLTKASYLADLPDRNQSVSQLIVGSPEYLRGLLSQAGNFERSELSQLVETLDHLEQTCRRTTQPAMHLEAGLLAFCHRHDMLLVRELSARVEHLEAALAGSSAALSSAPPNLMRKPAPAPLRPQSVEPPAAVATAQPAVQPAPVVAAAPPAVQPAPAVAPAQPPAQLPSAATEHFYSESQSVAAPPSASNAMQSIAHSGASTAVLAEKERSQNVPVLEDSAAVSTVAVLAATRQDSAMSSQAPGSSQANPDHFPESKQPALLPAAELDEQAAPPEEVDRVWGNCLDELQRRHIPTFSLASVHAIPLSLTSTELILGTKEAFVKTLEMKMDHIRAASIAAIGKPIAIRIRQISDVPAQRPPTKAREREGNTGAPASPRRPSSPADGDEESEPSDFTSLPSAPSANPVNQPEVGQQPSPAGRAEEGSPPASDRVNAAPERGNDSTLLKEAYKLFEGPGSRQIGDKKQQK